MFSGYPALFLSSQLSFAEEVRLREVIQKNGGKVSNERQGAVLVIDDFNKEEFSKDYNAAKAMNSLPLALGVKCINQSMALGLPLPTLEMLPVASRNFEGLTLCCSGMGVENKLFTLASFMMAKISDTLVASVTHLISDTALSEKFKGARDRRIPVVSPEWVFKSWQRGELLPPEKFPLPPLSGLKFCLTGIEPLERREELSRLVTQLGGSYQGDLTEDCTHLLCNAAKLSTDPKSKYYWAKQWGIKCTTSNWLELCAEQRCYVSEEGHEIMLPTTGTHLSQSQAQIVAAVKPDPMADAKAVEVQFMAGAVICALGVAEGTLKKIEAEVSRFGGRLEATITTDVTHLLVTDISRTDLDLFLGPYRPYVVSLRWLADSMRQMQLLAPSPYLLSQLQSPSEKKRPSPHAHGLTFLLLGLPLRAESEVRRVLTEHSADVLLAADIIRLSKAGARFPHITHCVTLHGTDVTLSPHLETLALLAPQQPRPVTTQWIEDCTKISRLLDPESAIIYSPLPFKPSFYKQFMGTVVLSVDGFPSAEVDNIRRLSALLGAKFTPVLTPGITTHLLAATKGTAATQTAISLGCYVVSGKWLEDCARLGFKVSELAAPPLSPAKPPPEPPLSPQTGRLDAHGLLTTSQLNPIQTTLVARVEEIDGPEEAPHSQRPPTQRPISPRPSPPSPPRATESKPIIFSELLRGVVVYVSKALSAREPELADKAAKMGAEHRWTFDEFVTHLVHHGRGHPELKRAQYHKVHLVSPQWILQCYARKQRLPEHAYPHTVNPNRSIDLFTDSQDSMGSQARPPSGVELETLPKRKRKRALDEPSPNFSPTKYTVAAGLEKAEDPTTLRRPHSAPSWSKKPFKHAKTDPFPVEPRRPVSAAGRVEEDRAPPNRHEEKDLDAHIKPEPEQEVVDEFLDSLGPPKLDLTRRKVEEPPETPAGMLTVLLPGGLFSRGEVQPLSPEHPASMPTIVFKGDEKTDALRKRILAHANGIGNILAQSEPGESKKPSQAPSQRPTGTQRKPEPSRPPVFMSSGLAAERLQRMAAQVQALGGRASTEKEFSLDCTHLIVAKPIRSEKFLAACAAGRWILRPEYLDECERAGRFVEEAPWEWNGSAPVPDLDRSTADAASRWRAKLRLRPGEGAFEGWKVALWASPQRQGGLERVLKAGGASLVVPAPEKVTAQDLKGLQYAVADREVIKAHPALAALIASARLPLLSPEFLSDVLVKFVAVPDDLTPYLHRPTQ